MDVELGEGVGATYGAGVEVEVDVELGLITLDRVEDEGLGAA